MPMKVTPTSSCEYLTAGSPYDVIEFKDDGIALIVDDDDYPVYVFVYGECPHIEANWQITITE